MAARRMRPVAWLAVGLLTGSALLPPRPATAQSDWSLERPRHRRPARAGARPGRRRARPPRSDRPPAANRTERLLRRYEAMLGSDPTADFVFRRWVALHRERDGSLQPLMARVERALAEQPEDLARQVLRARLLALTGRRAEAREALRRVIDARDPPAPRLLRLQARWAREDRDPAAEEAAWRRLLGLRNTPTTLRHEALRRLVELTGAQGRLEEARRLHEQLRRGAQGDPGVEGLLAAALVRANRPAEATEALQRALRRLGGATAARRSLLLAHARTLLEAGRPQQAIELLEQRLPARGLPPGVRAERFELLLEAHRRADRLEALVAALEKLPRSAPERARLGELYEEIGALEKAERALRAGLRRRPRDAALLQRLAELLGRLGREREQLELLRRLLRLGGGAPRLALRVLDLVRRVEGTDAARREAARLAARHRRDPGLLSEIAERLARWGAQREARRLFERVARMQPDRPEAWAALGSQRYEAGDVEGALRAWRHLLRDGSADAHARYARLLEEHGLKARAEAAWREVLRRAPDHLDALRALAEALEDARRVRRDSRSHGERLTEAAELWRRVLRHPRASAGLRRVARRRIVALLRAQGRLASARAKWRRLAAKDPPDPDATRLLIEEMLSAQPPRLDEAARLLQRLATARPDDVEALADLARLQEARGALRDAIVTLRRLAERDPASAASHLLRAAEDARALYDDALAVQLASEAVQRAPDDATAWRRLGELHLARQQLEQAARAFDRALALDGRLHVVALQLARLRLARGEGERAAQTLALVLRESPDDQLLLDAASLAVRLASSGERTATRLERALLDRLRSEPGRSSLRQALLQVVAAHVDLLDRLPAEAAAGPRGALGRRSLSVLLQALHGEDPGSRQLAVQMLDRLAPAGAVEPLLAFAAHAEGAPRATRLQAVRAAARAARPRDVPALAAFARRATDASLATPAVGAVGRHCSPKAAAALRALRGRPVTRLAAWVATLGCPEGHALEEAEALLRRGGGWSESTLRAALLLLGLRGEGPRLEALLAVTRRGSLRAATTALLAGGCALARLEQPPANVERLRSLAAARRFAPSRTMRRAASSLLARLAVKDAKSARCEPGEPAAELLTGSAASALDAVQRRLLDTAPHVGAEEAAHLGPVLLEAVRVALTASEGSRWLALRWLGDLVAGLPAPPLAPGALPPEQVLAALRSVLERVARSGPPGHRAAALSLLADLREPLDPDVLREALTSGEATLQRAALRAVAHQQRAPEVLLPAIARAARGARAWSIRRRAVLALGAFETPRGENVLVEVLREEPIAVVRQAACDALGRRGAPTPRLRRAIAEAAHRDRSEHVRRSCARLLEPEGAETAAP